MVSRKLLVTGGGWGDVWSLGDPYCPCSASTSGAIQTFFSGVVSGVSGVLVLKISGVFSGVFSNRLNLEKHSVRFWSFFWSFFYQKKLQNPKSRKMSGVARCGVDCSELYYIARLEFDWFIQLCRELIWFCSWLSVIVYVHAPAQGKNDCSPKGGDFCT